MPKELNVPLRKGLGVDPFGKNNSINYKKIIPKIYIPQKKLFSNEKHFAKP